MPLITGSLDHDGAVIAVLVGVSSNREGALRRVGHPVPARVPVRLAIDTGSFVTGLLPSVFRQLDLEPFDEIAVRTPSTKPGAPHVADLYHVNLVLFAGTAQTVLPGIYVIASEDFDVDEDEGIQGIIGRDILDRCVFQYLGPDQKFTLAW